MNVATGPVTALLAGWNDGDPKALDKLIPLVYGELRRVASRHLARERPGHTLQATALIHEVYLRLADQRGVRWRNRAHFLAIAARMMRWILIDHARARHYTKRGGGAVRVSLSEGEPVSANRATEVLAAILLKEPPPLALIAADTPLELERIIRKALAKEREKRYQTARDQLVDLRHLKHELEHRSCREHDHRTEAGGGAVAVEGAASVDGLLAEVRSHKKALLVSAVTGALLLVLAGMIPGSLRFSARDRPGVRREAAAARGDPSFPSARALYWQMTPDAQIEFVGAQARRISAMLGKASLTPGEDALRLIKHSLDRYAARRDSLSRDFAHEGLRPVYARASQYAPFIVQAFEKNGVPPVIGLYIAMVETEFHPCVESPIGLKGLYQFLPQTAQECGLAPADLCDVRKEANAAGLYMSDRMAEFGSDSASATLAILSYSIGGNSVRSNLRELSHRGKKERSFWSMAANAELLDGPFREAGLHYLPRFFAAAIIGENPAAFGLQIKPLSSYTEATE